MRFRKWKRREFITLLGGAATWPLAAYGQQGDRMRRVGAITGVIESDTAYQARFSAFRRELQRLGWTEGHNVMIDQRFGSAGDVDVVRKHARDLVALGPDVIVAGGSPNVGALKQASRTVPIVFVGVVDPVGAGFVANLARPGANITGFTSFEYGMAAKWLELLKEIDPRVRRAAVLRDPTSPAGIGLLAGMQGAASSLRVEVTPLDARDATETAGDQSQDRGGARSHRARHPARPLRRGDRMRRRSFITLLGGAAAWPLAAQGQRSKQMRRVGVLMSTLQTIRKVSRA